MYGSQYVKKGKTYTLTLTAGGYRVYEYDVDRPYTDNHYATLQKMIDNYVFPDGTPLKGLVDGTIP